MSRYIFERRRRLRAGCACRGRQARPSRDTIETKVSFFCQRPRPAAPRPRRAAVKPKLKVTPRAESLATYRAGGA